MLSKDIVTYRHSVSPQALPSGHPWPESRITIDAHGHAHLNLPSRPLGEAWGDLRRCSSLLARWLGRPVRDFACPYGAASRKVRWLVRAAGFRRAFATAQRPLAGPQELRGLQVPRWKLALWREIP